MGIVRIRPRGPGNDDSARQSFRTFPLNELAQEEGLLLEKNPDDAFDDCEPAEVGCEFVMVEDQICNVPYELYDLPDLKEILSLETWNSCLTEEERFSLAAYLPDMDRETFCIMIKELLNGDNIFFGSALEIFFNRLKGGFCSPQVSHLREALQFLQRRGYYHYLRSYHQNMAQKFMDIKRAWSNCHPNMSVEERVRIWNNRKDCSPVFLVDLNAFPAEEEILNKGEKNVATIPLLKKTRYMNEGINIHDPTVVLNDMAANKKTKAKGVLKIKPIEMNTLQNQPLQPFPSEPWKLSRRPPKGVLKIKPKCDPLGRQEQSRMIQIPPEQTTADLLGVHTSRFSTSQFAFPWDKRTFDERLQFVHQTSRDGNTYRSSGFIENHRREEFPNMAAGQSFQRKIKMVKDMRSDNAIEINEEVFPLKNNQKLKIFSHETSGLGEFPKGDNLRNSGQRSRVLHSGSADSYPIAPENHQGGRQITTVHFTLSEAVSGVPIVPTDEHQAFTKSSGHSKHKLRDNNDGVLKVPSVQMATLGVERENLMFPITYKRKKAYRKLNLVDSLKQPPLVADMEPVAPSGTVNMKAKAIKIKFKGWNDKNAEYNKKC
ncbi:uncharacterized protein LOC103718937 [Phoenix dactylifera]|uniref:Uncharacterized protein LOC103718937 n=1 Tax=Phoenix dactylifera TaxID=42345 RepID=A0A8B7CTF8_PHODC|nr:uncharacterized protein LOC103718937 [Phoenix dactylifera]XP_008806174.1 uncharacterized protein LOC103718937 [Phoenix dactylifera]